jgi:putative ABC transport system substrate-binding protein
MKSAKAVLAASAALCGILALSSCSNSGQKKVGILQFGTFPALTNANKGFVDALATAGFKDGEKIKLTVKNPETDGTQNTAFAQALASSCDMVYGIATPSATALKTSVEDIGNDIPVLFSAVTDPVGAKLVSSVEKPGANVTGASDMVPDALFQKEISILGKFSSIDTVAVLYTQTESNSVYQKGLFDKAIKSQGWTAVDKSIANATEINSAIASLDESVDAMVIPTDNIIAANIASVKNANEARTGHPLVIIGSDTGMLDGCVVALGVDYYALGSQVGAMAAKILGGAKPADLPIEYSQKSDIQVNTAWAASLGITIPEGVTD